MLKFILIILFIVVLSYCITNKVHIKVLTFLKKGYYKSDTPYGIYCYWNKQGSSKTQNAVAFLLENADKRIYANLRSIKGIHYKYFSGFNTLLEIGTTESDCIIFYDELFKGLYKGKSMKPKDKEKLMDFMSQMRKRNIICLTTAQEWLEIPIEFRRYVRYDIKCKLKSFKGYPIIIKEFNDTENIQWDNLQNEYVSPRIKTYIEHGRKVVVNSYDTFEQISTEEIAPVDTYNPYFESEYQIPSKSHKLLNDFQSSKSLGVATDLPTTTSKSVVSGQFTLTTPKVDTVKETDLSLIDKDFWNDIDPLDFTQTPVEHFDHLHSEESGQSGQ